MKIQSLNLRNYKRFINDKSINFNESLNIIIGENGSGKSSILQAIVSLIATATGDIKAPSFLDWGGFRYNLLQSGKLPPIIKSTIMFDENELEAIESLFKQLKTSNDKMTTAPSKDKKVEISLDYLQNSVRAGSPKRYFQFRGYAYAKQLASLNPVKSYFDSVGSIFWYTEKRDSYSFKKITDDNEDSENLLRRFLTSRYNFSQRLKESDEKSSSDVRDVYKELSKLYNLIFAPRQFVGPAPRTNPAEAYEPDWFYISDGSSQYEVSEMSAGERAILPILIDFVNFKINNSIVIIDEIELHLHPPLQQAFFRSLPHLGTNNQFIITTHSDYISTTADSTNIIRI